MSLSSFSCLLSLPSRIYLSSLTCIPSFSAFHPLSTFYHVSAFHKFLLAFHSSGLQHSSDFHSLSAFRPLSVVHPLYPIFLSFICLPSLLPFPVYPLTEAVNLYVCKHNLLVLCSNVVYDEWRTLYISSQLAHPSLYTYVLQYKPYPPIDEGVIHK